MTGRIEKTVFISYRRTNFPWALAIYQDLTNYGYDVFLDYKSIPSGDFEQVIIENIKSRAHFLVILTPSAVERCNDPNDWLRREIEIAIDNKRNIIPLRLESFEFSSPATVKALTGKLATLNKYQAPSVSAEYFDEAMARLHSDKYLDRPLESILHPVSDITRQTNEEQKVAVDEAAQVEKIELTAQEYFEKGVKYLLEGKLNEAIQNYTDSIRFNPIASEVYVNRGVAQAYLGNLDNAIADYDEAIRIQPDLAFAYLNRALSRRDRGDFDGAISDFAEGIRLNPDLADAHFFFNRGIAWQEKGDIDNAMSDFSKSISLVAKFADTHFYRGVLLSNKGEFDPAIKDFTQAILIKPDLVNAYLNRGSLYKVKAQFDLAIQDYDKAIALGASDEEAYNSRGSIRRELGDLDGALQDYDKAIQFKPDYVDAFNNRGVSRCEKGDIKGGIEDFDKAISYDPNHLSVLFNRGSAYWNLGDFENALHDYQDALQLQPGNLKLRLMLFSVLRKLGKEVEANKEERLIRNEIVNETEYDQACFESVCGNTDKALELLSIALEKNQPSGGKAWVRNDPDFRNLRNDQRFKELVGE